MYKFTKKTIPKQKLVPSKTSLILEILENTLLTLYFSSIYKNHIPETLHNVQTRDMVASTVCIIYARKNILRDYVHHLTTD